MTVSARVVGLLGGSTLLGVLVLLAKVQGVITLPVEITELAVDGRRNLSPGFRDYVGFVLIVVPYLGWWGLRHHLDDDAVAMTLGVLTVIAVFAGGVYLLDAPATPAQPARPAKVEPAPAPTFASAITPALQGCIPGSASRAGELEVYDCGAGAGADRTAIHRFDSTAASLQLWNASAANPSNSRYSRLYLRKPQQWFDSAGRPAGWVTVYVSNGIAHLDYTDDRLRAMVRMRRADGGWEPLWKAWRLERPLASPAAR
jgi:hypothetical protein